MATAWSGARSSRSATLFFFSSYSTSERVCSTILFRSTGFISGFFGRANDRMFWQRRRIRWASWSMMPMYLRGLSVTVSIPRIMPVIIMIDVSGFLISWTIPEPRRPSSAIFSDWISSSIIFFFSVRSWQMHDMPTMRHRESFTGEMLMAAGNGCPSRRPETSRACDSPVSRTASRAALTFPRSGASTSISHPPPSTAASVWLKILAAPRFQTITVLSRSKPMMASLDDSTRSSMYLRYSM